jgi:molecular chaperone Hsp33
VDRIERGLTDQNGLRFLAVDVTRTAGTLVTRHQCGSAATEILSQAIAAVALLTSDLENEEECISVHWKVDGPIHGILVEGSQNGNLRGYTNQKTLGPFDNQDPVDLSAVMGRGGEFAVIQSVPGNLIYSARLAAQPADVEKNLARFYNQSRQTPTAVALVVDREDTRVTRAAGVVAQKLPDGDTKAFVNVLELFNSGDAHRLLRVAASLDDIMRGLGVDDGVVVADRELQFGCRCSREKIRNVVASLPKKDLEAMIAEDKTQTVTCHFCGEVYSLERPEIERLARTRGD